MVLVIGVQAQSNFYEQVKTMWFNGNKQGVLDIANQRLAVNSNDIAGLLLRCEYEGENLLFDAATNTMARIIELIPTFNGTNFAAEIPWLEEDYEVMKIIITNYPPEEYLSDLAKTNALGKTMACDDYIKALQADGYFE